jgi:hypothetical protein
VEAGADGSAAALGCGGDSLGCGAGSLGCGVGSLGASGSATGAGSGGPIDALESLAGATMGASGADPTGAGAGAGAGSRELGVAETALPGPSARAEAASRTNAETSEARTSP